LTELFLIRHGQSSNNALTDQSRRVCDPELTEIGQVQAERVATYVAERGHLVGTGVSAADGPALDRLYCSAMIRALHTASPIGKALGLRPEAWVDIHETGGIFLERPDGSGADSFPGEGRSAILARFPDCILPEGIGEEGWWNGGRESAEAGQQRALSIAQILRRQATAGERIGLVTHGDFMSHLIKALLGVQQGPEVYIDHRNTAITCVKIPPGEGIVVGYANRFEHLEKAQIT